ncbi:MAG: 3-isopropylmalate dehydratase small subunit, partial [Cyanobacteria bacterium]|nr:3-isopropylmalate dehydratase small subunit [Cyanobacteriota bacterium]
KDVDTDQIIPAQFLTSVSRDGYGENLFRRLRDTDPQFPLDQPRYKGAQVLVTGSNFGCGSSREHAVWALTDAGIRVVVAESFADIFASNSAKNGLLLVTLPAEIVEKILQECSVRNVIAEVDLQTQLIRLSELGEYSFSYDPFCKHCLLEGLDDIDYLHSYAGEIANHRATTSKHWQKATLEITTSAKADKTNDNNSEHRVSTLVGS